MDSKVSFWKHPAFWLSLTVVFYTAFEILNATIVCKSSTSAIITSGLAFFGFWSLVGYIVFLVQERVATKKFSWWWLGLVVIIVGLIITDTLFSKTCRF